MFHNQGGNVMLVGIIFQTGQKDGQSSKRNSLTLAVATITIYASCAIEFFVRYSKEHPLKSAPLRSDFSVGQIRRPMDLRIRAMSSGLIVTTAFLFIRSGYRTIELSDGWDGRIITTETYFNVFDGAMVVLAMYTLNISHPGVLLKHLNEQATNSAKKPSDSDSSIGMAV
ncbi:hypothetical protein DXG01_011430 [Tephrocybe rancida]|nr:hypothetical protein DXG01_011430 [Tephrocybe rancida]